MVNRIEVSGSPPIHPMGAFIVSAREPDAAVSWHRVAESRHFVEEDNEWRKSDAGRKKKRQPAGSLFDSLPSVNQRVVSSRTGRKSTSCEFTEASLGLVHFHREDLFKKKVK